MSKGIANKIFKAFLRSSGVCIDTRKINKNEIFFAFSGQNVDGALYAKEALDKGALLVIVESDQISKIDDIIHVKDVLKALQILAIQYRDLFDIPILAITGSNGKTTTKELLHKVLSPKYITHYTKGNFNNHIGVPLTILAMPRNTEFAIIEMGANHLGEIKELCQIAKPNFGVITNIGKAHIEGFGSLEGVLQAKIELFDYLNMNDNTIFLNYNDTLLKDVSPSYKNVVQLMNYSKNEEWNFESTMNNPYLCIDVLVKDKVIKCQTSLIGEYNAMNIFIALFIGTYFEVGIEEGINAIASYRSMNNRSSLIKSEGYNFIMDAYNANPASMQAAIDNFIVMDVPDKVLVLGDMLELGMDSLLEHQKMVDYFHQFKWKGVILVGKQFLNCNTYDYHSCKNVSDAADLILSLNLTASWILLKGSRGIQLELLMEKIK